ncbi:MAG: hypothetical protein E7337_03170 [Clostridiales bacterium]|nr:hypothetical protein [Clostridiales bacterium]
MRNKTPSTTSSAITPQLFHVWPEKLPIFPLPKIDIPILKSIPVLGDLFSGNTLLVYVSWLLVILSYVLIYKTPLGFWMRAAGKHPESLRAAGKSPEKMKYLASALCGLFSGLAGAHLSLGYLTMFTENMSASRGFIAVACVIFGASNPPWYSWRRCCSASLTPSACAFRRSISPPTSPPSPPIWSL